MVTIFQELMLQDLLVISQCSRAMQRMYREVIRRRLRSILVPFTGTRYASFLDALRTSNGVITGSSAHTMLTGGDTVQGRDLNIIVPHRHFQDMHAFIVHTLGYENISSIPHPAMRAVVAHFGKYKSNCNIITISSGQRGASILHIILNAPTSADMLFMTTGGLTCFYPQWMQQHVAIQTHTGDRVYRIINWAALASSWTTF